MSYKPTQNSSEWSQQVSQTTHNTGTQEQQHSPSGHTPDAFRNVLSPEELRVLRECNKESFYYRCVPLSVLFSSLTYVAMKNGYLRKGEKYGYVPKVLLGMFVGYIGGKFSYQNVCAEKIMKLPNSNLGNSLRKRRGMVPITGSEEPQVTEENSFDLTQHIEGLDSYDQTIEDFPSYTDTTSDSVSKSFVSYDDLRKSNREDYVNRMTEKYKKQSSEGNRSSTFQSSSSIASQNSRVGSVFEADTTSSSPRAKNKYGDEWGI